MNLVALFSMNKYLSLGWKVYQRIKASEDRDALLKQFEDAMADGTITAKEWSDIGRALGVVPTRTSKKK